MTIILPKWQTVISQMPKTGCRWRMAVIRKLGIHYNFTTHENCDSRHMPLKFLPAFCKDYIVIGTIRNPLEWLRSYWCMRQSNNIRSRWTETWPYWREENFDADCRSSNFEEFIDKYLEFYPGFVSRLSSDFNDNADYLCRTEYLTSDFLMRLKDLGFKFEFERVLTIPKKGESSTILKTRARISPSRALKVFEAENYVGMES